MEAMDDIQLLTTSIDAPQLCEICFDTVTSNQDFVKLHVALPCPFRCCKACALVFLSVNINERQIEGLTCPSLDCKEVVGYTDVHRIINQFKDDVERADILLAKYDVAYDEAVQTKRVRDERLNGSFRTKACHFLRDQADSLQFSMWYLTANTKRCPGKTE
jgi:hypothetical protein